MNTVMLPMPIASNPKLMIDLNDQEMRNRLLQLGTDNLIDSILEMASKKDATADILYYLVGTSHERLEWAKDRLWELKCNPGCEMRFEREMHSIAFNLLGDTEPYATLMMLLGFFNSSFFGRDEYAFSFEDSGGYHKISPFTVYWEIVKPRVIALVKETNDPYWVGSVIVNVFKKNAKLPWHIHRDLTEFLPESSLSFIGNEINELARKCGADRRDDQKEYGYTLEIISRRLNDSTLFERAKIYQFHGSTERAAFEIAQYYLACNDHESVLRWLKRAVPTNTALEKVLQIGSSWERKEQPLLSCLVYRAKIDSLLQSKKPSMINVLTTLQALMTAGRRVSSWCGFEDEESYLTNLRKREDFKNLFLTPHGSV